MPGARAYGFRIGDNAELLSEFVISRLAFVSKVPRTEDVGHDFLCSLAEREANLFKAGPFFTVQAKNNRGPIIYQKTHEIDWIKNQENPFFVCVANLNSLSVEFYTTWNLLIGILHQAAQKIVLIPGNAADKYKPPETEPDLSEQRIYLGKPILNISAKELINDENVNKYASVLKRWIEIDRENIVNRYAGMYWIVGPMEYETNELVPEPFQPIGVFLWNPKNLEKCKINFGRSATALRMVIRAAFGKEREEDIGISQMISDLEKVLRSMSECLDPFAKEILRNEIGIEIE
ncbi:MAG: hypothetical protein ABIJ52_13670 [Pseudomonadota bacterium]